ncbi:MAG: hypothetical protein OES57_06385 [Acidimicrobiia bacterium]|nr:hypothetical protein [Acidimicrobiia bacterium]
MIIDQVAPNPPFALARSRMIDADAHTVMAAVQTANLLDGATPRLLTWARDLPNNLAARWHGRAVERLPRSVTFAELSESDTFKVLGEVPDEQFVAGAIGRFWERDFGWVDFEPEHFATFAEPGYAKTVIGFHAVAREHDRTLLIYESRTVTTDGDARRRFGRYWKVLQPFVAILLRSALQSIAREVDRQRSAPVIELRPEATTEATPPTIRAAR